MFAVPFLLSENTKPHCDTPKQLSQQCVNSHVPVTPVGFTNMSLARHSDDTTITKKRKLIIETDQNGIKRKKIIIDGDTLTQIGVGANNFYVWKKDSLINSFDSDFKDQAYNFQFKFKNFDLKDFEGHDFKMDSLMKNFKFHMDFPHQKITKELLKSLNGDLIENNSFREKKMKEAMEKMNVQIDSLKMELDRLKERLPAKDK